MRCFKKQTYQTMIAIDWFGWIRMTSVNLTFDVAGMKAKKMANHLFHGPKICLLNEFQWITKKISQTRKELGSPCQADTYPIGEPSGYLFPSPEAQWSLQNARNFGVLFSFLRNRREKPRGIMGSLFSAPYQIDSRAPGPCVLIAPSNRWFQGNATDLNGLE